MSINYLLYAEADLSPSELLKRLGSGLGLQLHTKQIGRAFLSEGIAGLGTAAGAVEPPLDQFMREDFDFNPLVSLTLRMDKTDLHFAMGQVVKALCALRDRLPGDLLLLREHDSVAYQRRAGRETITAGDALWHNPEHLQWLGLGAEGICSDREPE